MSKQVPKAKEAAAPGFFIPFATTVSQSLVNPLLAAFLLTDDSLP